MPCCVFKRLFPHRGMNVCLICEASLSHHTLYMGNLVAVYICITYFPVGGGKKDYQNNTQKCITAPILKPTDDQKPETFFGGVGANRLFKNSTEH